MRWVISWTVWAVIMLILFLIPLWFGWSALNSLPHARTLARDYAASSRCEPSTLLSVAAPPQFPRALSAAPSGTLCEVLPMTVQRKDFFHGHTRDYYSVILVNETGRQRHVYLDADSWQFWNDLQASAKVNVQLVEGKVALIANGATLARTSDHPEVMLQSLRMRRLFALAFSLPFLAFLAISVRGWMKKSRRLGSGAFELQEREARAWRNFPDNTSPVLECPSFQGRPLAQARQELETAGYRMGRISFIDATSLPAGTIVAQVPLPGSQVAPGAAFNFQVSIDGNAPARSHST
jgi:hypothetical protein